MIIVVAHDPEQSYSRIRKERTKQNNQLLLPEFMVFCKYYNCFKFAYYFQADVIANSVGPKTSPTANVLSFGDLAQQFGKAGGQGLVDRSSDVLDMAK